MAGQPPSNAGDFATPPGLARGQFRAMGTTVSLLLPADQLDPGMEATRRLLAEWEATFSRFLPTSALSYVNQHAGERVAISPLFLRVLTTALAAARASGGLYDPTLLRQVISVGYDRSFEHLPDTLPALAPEYRPRPGGDWRGIEVDPIRSTVLLPPQTGLDFGGIAKGMAVDAAIARLRSLGIGCALINAGGDLAVLGMPPEAAGWTLAIEGQGAPWVLTLEHGALATSGSARRRWQQGDQTRHHLLDPRTGEPSTSSLWTASVVAARCEQAEVAAKVAFLLDATEGAAFLSTHALAGLFNTHDGRWQPVGLWPAASNHPQDAQRGEAEPPYDRDTGGDWGVPG